MIANILAGLVALIHALHRRARDVPVGHAAGPQGLRHHRGFRTESKVLAANQGLYNGFLAAGLIWGIWLGEAGDPVKIFFLLCVAVAGVYGAATVGMRILLIQTVPAVIALAAVGLALSQPVSWPAGANGRAHAIRLEFPAVALRGGPGHVGLFDRPLAGADGADAPFIVFRILVYAGIAIAYVLVTGVGAGSAGALGHSATTTVARARCLGRHHRLRADRRYHLLPARIHPLHRQGRPHRGAGRIDRRRADSRTGRARSPTPPASS